MKNNGSFLKLKGSNAFSHEKSKSRTVTRCQLRKCVSKIHFIKTSNFKEILSKLSPKALGFNAAIEFSIEEILIVVVFKGIRAAECRRCCFLKYFLGKIIKMM